VKKGEPPQPNFEALADAQLRQRAHERQTEALAVARREAREGVRRAAVESRDEWARHPQEAAAAARKDGRERLAQLAGALEPLAQARLTGQWLRPGTGGLDSGQKAGGLRLVRAPLRGSHDDRLAVVDVLAALASVLEDPEPPRLRPTPEQPVGAAA
jgi:hypothetical protein